MAMSIAPLRPDPAGYVDRMTALGWVPVLVIHAGGRRSLFERYPGGPQHDTIGEAMRVSAESLATAPGRAAAERDLIDRGMVVFA